MQINPNIIENPSFFLKQISDLLELNYSKIESDFFIRATGKNPNEPYFLIKNLSERHNVDMGNVTVPHFGVHISAEDFANLKRD